MLELTLQRGGKRLFREPLSAEPFTIGRARDNSLRLLDPEISRYHCRIERRDDAIYLVDLSMNGTLVNGEQRAEARIDAGDRIAVGPWTVLVEATIDAVPVKTLAAEAHGTRVLSYDPKQKRFTTERVEIEVHSPDQAPMVKRVAKGEILLGHHAACDVAIADPYVSRRHCKLTVAGNQIHLTDLGSTNGVFVGDARVAQVSMPPAGSFRIGRSAIRYRICCAQEDLSPSRTNQLGKMLGASTSMRELFGLIARVAPSDAAVLITGESGTGKELAAREIHRLSERRRGPFIAVNCGAIPATLIESHLFGHERGAFTGAIERLPGLIEQAKEGTLFLDEVGELPLELQTRFLRVLEEKSFRRVGGQEENAVDFRLVAATNRDLLRMVREGRFREDLYFRLLVVPVVIPPLRDRAEDIALLAEHFLTELAKEACSPALTDAALAALAGYPWPGNARELRNTIERSLLLAGKDVLDAGDLQFAAVEGPRDENGHLRNQERSFLVDTLARCKGNLSHAARQLGIARSTLQAKIKKYEIEIPGR
jgi:transcriptional regulator with AAA-type ATPase domain/pSer/pThr/pTyr-binding forkhead associated (FHA) protein